MLTLPSHNVSVCESKSKCYLVCPWAPWKLVLNIIHNLRSLFYIYILYELFALSMDLIECVCCLVGRQLTAASTVSYTRRVSSPFYSNFFLYLLKRALCSATAAVIVASEGNMALVVWQVTNDGKSLAHPPIRFDRPLSPLLLYNYNYRLCFNNSLIPIHICYSLSSQLFITIFFSS